MDLLPLILSHTPIWVFLLLAYLVWQGIRALSDQTVPVRRMVIVPVMFTLWGLYGMARTDPTTDRIACWIAAALLSAPIGFLTGPTLLAVDTTTALVRRRGSTMPLLRNVLVFCSKYISAVAVIMRHDLATLAAAAIVSGLTAGYFTGWLVSFAARYRQAPRSLLQAA